MVAEEHRFTSPQVYIHNIDFDSETWKKLCDVLKIPESTVQIKIDKGRYYTESKGED